MLMTKWRLLYKRIASEHQPASDQVSKPTLHDLNQFENAFSVQLPKAYRTFIRVFGAGEFSVNDVKEETECSIAIRFCAPACECEAYDLAKYNLSFRSAIEDPMIAYYQSLNNRDFFRRLVLFADDFSGNQFALDPGNKAHLNRRDYSVHFWRRLDRATTVLPTSFRTFIEEVCWGNAFFESFFNKKARGLRRIFIPFLRNCK